MMAEFLSSSLRLGVGFRRLPSTQGIDLFPTAVQTFIRRRAAWFLPTPLLQSEVTPALARLHTTDLSKTSSCCYLSHLKTPGARVYAGPLVRCFGCWLHNKHSVLGGCVETVSGADFFYPYCFTQTNGEGQDWAVFITLSSRDSSLRSNIQ